ncbi:MAG: Crp/Fnr family transcriptional regulator [Burkholderiales bacterium]|nr:Crp/Fnr family transcriptional regulator [Burkholderiales bacterium]
MHAIHVPLRTVTPGCPQPPPCLRLKPAVPAGLALQDNQLLAALPAADRARWSEQLEPVEMPLGQVLYESGHGVSHVHFPTSAIVSLQNQTADGHCAEVAAVGSDGVVGVPLLMGGMSTNGRAVVHSAGQGYRMRGHVVIEEFNRGGAVMQLLLHYLQALLTQITQTATCNRHHSVEQQLCRLLLLSLDRVQGTDLQATQEMLAGRLGVRRESVTAAALTLQQAGLIRYARGHVEVLERAGLEDRVCECYSVVKLECDRLLPKH